MRLGFQLVPKLFFDHNFHIQSLLYFLKCRSHQCSDDDFKKLFSKKFANKLARSVG